MSGPPAAKYNILDHRTEDVEDTPWETRPPKVYELLTHQPAQGQQREHQGDPLANPRFRGICGTHGNAVFTNTPVGPPATVARDLSTSVPGYVGLRQHPMYTTTHGDLGLRPSMGNLPFSHNPKNMTFTKIQSIGGNYEDSHLTTELDKHMTGV